MLERLSLLEIEAIARVSRRALASGAALGVVSLAVSVLLGYALVGLGICIGIAAGAVNVRLVVVSVARAQRCDEAHRRRPIAANTLLRLGAVTVVAVALLLAVPPAGAGLLAGLALFQFAFLANVIAALLAQARTAAQGGEAA